MTRQARQSDAIADPIIPDSEAIGPDFEFEIVTVNELGRVIRSERQRGRRFVERLPNDATLEMVAIPEGSFQMGSRTHEGYPDEHPQHGVRVQPFWMARYPVTQEQWQAVIGSLPRCRTVGRRRPVDRVSWNDAAGFCRRLAEKTGRAYRLPSEAEWEYTCRAGTTTPFYFGKTITADLANYVGEHTYLDEPKGIYRHGATDVGSFPANAFGLCDMHGNVWEWNADTWHDDYVDAPTDGSVWARGITGDRVLRGGCWHDPPNLCRSAARLRQPPDQGEDFFGFRVALTSLERQPAGAADSIGQTVRRWLGRAAG